MQLHQFRTDGFVDVTDLNPRDVDAAKQTALAVVAHPAQSGVYRIKFVDAEYQRDVFDTYNLPSTPKMGMVVFMGAAA